MKESDGGISEVGPVSDRALLLIYEAQLTELRARAEAAEAKLDDLKPLRHALEHSVSTTIHRGVVAERDAAVNRAETIEEEHRAWLEKGIAQAREEDTQWGMLKLLAKDAVDERDAVVALGKRTAQLAAWLFHKCEPRALDIEAMEWGDKAHDILADARKAGWLT